MKLYSKFALSTVPLSIVIASIVFIIFFTNTSNTLLKNSELEFSEISERIQLALKTPLYTYDDQTVIDTIKIELKNKYTFALTINDNSGSPIFGFKEKGQEFISVESLEEQTRLSEEAYWTEHVLIKDGDFIIGDVIIYFTDSPIREFIEELLIKQLIQSGLLVAILLSIMFLALAAFILRPLKTLRSAVVDIAEGEGDLTKEVNISSNDEIGFLAGDTNQFINTIKQMVTKLKEISGEINHVQDNLLENTSETASAIIQIMKNIESVQKEAMQLENQILNSSKNIDALFTIIEEERQDIVDQTSAVEESSASINQMIASLNSIAKITISKKAATEHLVITAQKGDSKLNDTIKFIEEINNNVDSISGMLDIINNISAQTNLLAMNAAIEAAHAGDSGKGFSVVADEIRKLAESSSFNSKEISSVLTEVLGNIKNVSNMGLETKQAFIEINREVIEVSEALSEIEVSTSELSKGGEEIVRAMSLLTDKTQQINDKSMDINREATEVNESFNLVKEISNQLESAMKEITVGVSSISTSMDNIQDVTSVLDRNIKEQNKGLNRFKTEV